MKPASQPAEKSVPPHPVLQKFYGSADERRAFVNKLFDEAAPDYDWVSGLMSFWSDGFYRKDVLKRAGLTTGMVFLGGTRTGVEHEAGSGLNMAFWIKQGPPQSHLHTGIGVDGHFRHFEAFRHEPGNVDTLSIGRS